METEREALRRDLRMHRWIRIREVGWGLLIAWQVLALGVEFAPVVDLASRPIRILGKVLGLFGVLLVAYGFERLMRIEHQHAINLAKDERRRAREG